MISFLLGNNLHQYSFWCFSSEGSTVIPYTYDMLRDNLKVGKSSQYKIIMKPEVGANNSSKKFWA